MNFPVNISEVGSSLPRTLDNAGIVLIVPPRTGSSDSTETPVTQTYFTVYMSILCIWSLVMVAPLSQSFINEGESSVIRRDLQHCQMLKSHTS